MTQLIEHLRDLRLIPVIQINRPEDAIPLGEILLKNNLPVAEITLRTDAALEAIRQLNSKLPELFLIAGTVTAPKFAALARDAGAKAMVSPGFNPLTVAYCKDKQIPIIPGVATPSDIELAMNHDINFVKFFPAEANGGVAMLKAISGPYQNMQFMPTGGINKENLMNYLSLNNVVCCGGSWFVDSKLIGNGDWEKVDAQVQLAVELFRNKGEI
ncbi:bifunctional 4-hydroxy-2-oxoglutarate aldolase/2-dehydro-3-deoxy-phosphogluconate aldolase [Aeromonas caviae]|uniref:bifunctional 4-hydroxy-2-oxoglutarate aldolase/2-dehydro-3-deoxy-phosphogluconate aldolase n=1 Tax=Aeromonas caviae TaxID=648 RepID=UPI003F7496A5